MKQQIQTNKIEWREIEFLDCLEREASNNKLKLKGKEFLEEGKYLIIDQGEEFIAGYTNDRTKVYDKKLPVVVFGDHTRILKFVDFSFALGADGVKILVPKDNISPKYLFYVIKNLKLKSLGYSRHYKLLKGKKIPIPFKDGKPDLKEQERIVKILEKAEKLKERGKNANDLLDEYLKSVFNEMFYNKGFEEVKLEDVCKTSSGGTPSRTKKEYWENGTIPWIKSGDLNKNRITEVDEFITEMGLKNSSAKYIQPETVLIAMYGATAGKTSVSKIKATTNQAVCALVPEDKKLNKIFLLYWLRSNYDYIISLAFGGGQPNISQQVIRSLKIPLPPVSTQQKFSDIVEQIEKMKENIQKTKQNSEELFNSLMSKAFRGELVR